MIDESMLDKSKLYYLSHPCTSYGVKKANIADARLAGLILKVKYGICVVNPITIMPDGCSEEEAMIKCKKLYEACDEVIFCENWRNSKGCCEEYNWVLKDKKNSYLFKNSILL